MQPDRTPSAARACPDCGMSTCAKDGCAVAEVRADYLRLRRCKRLLFPELVCPVHDEIGTPAASSKPSDYVWCHGKGADNGHWFTKETTKDHGR